jgi:hypothetical protein
MATNEPEPLISTCSPQAEPNGKPGNSELNPDRVRIAQVIASLMANKWMRDRTAQTESLRCKPVDKPGEVK